MGIARGDVLMYRTFQRREYMHDVAWQMKARPGGRARRAPCLLLRGAILLTSGPLSGCPPRQFVLGEAEGTQEAGTDTLVDNLRRDGSERTYVLQRRVEAPRVLLDSVHAGVFR